MPRIGTHKHHFLLNKQLKELLAELLPPKTIPVCCEIFVATIQLLGLFALSHSSKSPSVSMFCALNANGAKITAVKN